jgi:hypothetical protein
VAFPQTPIDLLAEMQIGGVWTDVTADLYARAPLTIERGRQDEGARVDAARVSFQLNNRGNKYSPRNPRSANYGLIGRNTPVRFSVPSTEPYLAMTGASGDIVATPDTAALDIVGDIDVRIEATATWAAGGHQTLIGKWGAVDGQRSWILRLLDGQATFVWSPTGLSAAAITVAVPLPALPHRAALRATLDVDNGAGGYTAVVYTAASLSGPWTVVGTVTGSGTTSIFASTAPVEIAPTQVTASTTRLPWRGRLHRAEIRSGIAGSVVASPDVRALAVGTTSWADTAGRTWTLAGAAAIIQREYRVVAEASSWPPRWDESGQDVYVPMEAAGVLRRLGQGAKPLASPLRRRIPQVGAPVAYWPMEEGREATQAYSPVTGVAPLNVTGFDFAADDTLLGSAPLPRLTAPASMAGSVPTYTGTGQWMVAAVFYFAAAPASSTRMLTFTTTGTAQKVLLEVDATSILLEGYTAAGATVFSILTPSGGYGFFGAWTRLEITAEQSGASTRFRVGWVDVSGGGYGADDTVAATAGTVTGISTDFGPLAADLRLGHLGVFASSATSVYDNADDGWLGEDADSRIRRLCLEEGVPVTAETALTDMGSQRAASLLTLLGECAASDLGVLHEDRERPGLRYKARASFYNQPVQLTLDYSQAGHVAPPLEPVDDDQRVRNDRTVTRVGGSSARSVDTTSALSVLAPPLGVGTYDDAQTLSLATDRQPEGVAAWLLLLGTWDEARYPTVHINLAAAPALISNVLALEIGDRIQIINPPTWLPPGPIDLIVEGYTEVIGHPNSWDVVLNCSPAGPWSVAVADDVVLGRANTSGSTLVSGVTSTATALSVATTSGPLWSATAAPFNIKCGGEVMTVTAVSGASSPQTFTVTRSVNGIVKAQLASAAIAVAQPARAAL